MLRNPDDGDWLMIRRNYQAWNYSPLADIDRANAGELELAWCVGDERGRLERALADSPRRHHVSREHRSGGAGAGRDHRRSHLGARVGGGDHRLLRHEPQPRHLRGQALHGHSRRAAHRPRTPAPASGYGMRSSPTTPRASAIRVGRSWSTERSCRGSAGATATRWRAASSAATTRTRVSGSGASTRSPAPTSRAATTWANVPDYLRGGGDTWITGSYDPGLDLVYFGVAQAKPWVALSRGMTVNDPALYTNSTVALRPGGREPGVALPARAGRDPGSGRGVRAGPGRHRRPQDGLQRRQARHPVEAGPGDRRVPRAQGDRLSERVRFGSIPRPAPSPTGRISPMRGSSSSCRRVRAPPEARTGNPMGYHPGAGAADTTARPSPAWSWRHARSPSSSAPVASG